VRVLFAVIAIFVSSSAFSEDYLTPNELYSGIAPAVSNSVTTHLSISCGKGSVDISSSDGKVTITDCSLDKAANAFWKAVETIGIKNCVTQK